ncbi:MAG: hypothetical protein KGH93_03020 [Patescibacteria group bacterium]|nr:hypothetical protein [Patescibacteria group bacterium]MDE1946142.1 hypothetical protein [Patescibacteria group bacterium]
METRTVDLEDTMSTHDKIFWIHIFRKRIIDEVLKKPRYEWCFLAVLSSERGLLLPTIADATDEVRALFKRGFSRGQVPPSPLDPVRIHTPIIESRKHETHFIPRLREDVNSILGMKTKDGNGEFVAGTLLKDEDSKLSYLYLESGHKEAFERAYFEKVKADSEFANETRGNIHVQFIMSQPWNVSHK